MFLKKITFYFHYIGQLWHLGGKILNLLTKTIKLKKNAPDPH
jgi:hypothetical protein